MFDILRNAWKIPELRKKILYTLLLLILFRLGMVIPVPFITADAIREFFSSTGAAGGTIFGYLDMLSGGSFSKATLFSLSVYPYITSSIIIQLLTIAVPALEKLSKEGEDGRKKIMSFTRYGTVVLGGIQAFGYYVTLANQGALTAKGFFPAIVIILSFIAGSVVIMWLGEKIDAVGIGNGISLILFAGIVQRIPSSIYGLVVNAGNLGDYILLPIIGIVALAVLVFVVFMDSAERRIPVQYAKRMVGRKMYGGQNTHIPIKVSMTGVLPIIFAGSFVHLPSTIAMFFPSPERGSFWYNFLQAIGYQSPIYAVAYFLLIIFFNYFYVSIQYNPVEIANNIKKNGGSIPGIRPGKPTSDFIAHILSKLTFLGAMFLGIIATVPILLNLIFKMGNLALGGTTLLIVVGVSLETMKTLEAQMLTRHYKGFLE